MKNEVGRQAPPLAHHSHSPAPRPRARRVARSPDPSEQGRPCALRRGTSAARPDAGPQLQGGAHESGANECISATSKRWMWVSHFIVFTAGRVGGVFFKMLFLSRKDSRPLAPEWAAGPCHSCNISGKKDGVGSQGLSQRAPQANSAGCAPPPHLPRKRKPKPRKHPTPWAPEAGSAAWPSSTTSCLLPFLPTCFSMLPSLHPHPRLRGHFSPACHPARCFHIRWACPL